MLIYTAIALFLLGALAGIVMATQIISQNRRPTPLLAGIHGVLVASGLVLLVVGVVIGSTTLIIKVGLGVLLVAALFGFYLASLHIRGQQHPTAAVVTHATLAVVGVLLLIGSVIIVV